MAADRPRGWAFLPEKVVHGIFCRIPCEVDRLYAGRVCRSWRVALAKLKPPAAHPQLPWLLLPESDGRGPTFSCVLSGWRSTHPFFLPHATRRARYFGSYDGAWVFLAVAGRGDQAQDHVLVNLHNFQYLNLPNAISLFNRYDLDDIAIVAATLSRPPTEQGCIVAAIIELPFSPAHQVAFWRMGDPVVPGYFQAVWPPEEVEDLIYFKVSGVGAFVWLTREEDLRLCAEPIFHEANVKVQSNLLRFKPRGRDGQPVLARYLVPSREDILMVVRLAAPLQREPAASEFRVFERKEFVDGNFKSIWNSLSTLDGRMMFVGRGCSRSYEGGDRYPGMEGVYFLDDRSFREPIFHDPGYAYRCGDNGKWSEASLRLDHCFPERAWSKYSPPVWILPGDDGLRKRRSSTGQVSLCSHNANESA